MGSLRIAIGADLTSIKDGLDLFIRSAESDMTRLRELEVPVRKVADTLGMIGQGALRERLKRQADWLKTLDDPEPRVDEQMLMSMAGDILFIETSLDNLASLKQKPNLSDARRKLTMRLSFQQGEFEKLTDSVIHEAEVDMAKNREAIRQLYCQSPGAGTTGGCTGPIQICCRSLQYSEPGEGIEIAAWLIALRGKGAAARR